MTDSPAASPAARRGERGPMPPRTACRAARRRWPRLDAASALSLEPSATAGPPPVAIPEIKQSEEGGGEASVRPRRHAGRRRRPARARGYARGPARRRTRRARRPSPARPRASSPSWPAPVGRRCPPAAGPVGAPLFSSKPHRLSLWVRRTASTFCAAACSTRLFAPMLSPPGLAQIIQHLLETSRECQEITSDNC